MDSMTGTAVPNSMTIRANVTIPMSAVSGIGSHFAAAQIARRDLPVHRARLVRGVLPVPRVYPEPEVRQVRKVPKV